MEPDWMQDPRNPDSGGLAMIGCRAVGVRRNPEVRLCLAAGPEGSEGIRRTVPDWLGNRVMTWNATHV